MHYADRLQAGETLDASEPGDPLLYLHGHDNIVPGLERKLSGKKVGDKLQVIVQPADGYGERDVRATQLPSNRREICVTALGSHQVQGTKQVIR